MHSEGVGCGVTVGCDVVGFVGITVGVTVEISVTRTMGEGEMVGNMSVTCDSHVGVLAQPVIINRFAKTSRNPERRPI